MHLEQSGLPPERERGQLIPRAHSSERSDRWWVGKDQRRHGGLEEEGKVPDRER